MQIQAIKSPPTQLITIEYEIRQISYLQSNGANFAKVNLQLKLCPHKSKQPKIKIFRLQNLKAVYILKAIKNCAHHPVYSLASVAEWALHAWLTFFINIHRLGNKLSCDISQLTDDRDWNIVIVRFYKFYKKRLVNKRKANRKAWR